MAFTDAVVAFAITIMVIDLHVLTSPTWEKIQAAIPLLIAYATAFIMSMHTCHGAGRGA